jgi:hypothetical protein
MRGALWRGRDDMGVYKTPKLLYKNTKEAKYSSVHL